MGVIMRSAWERVMHRFLHFSALSVAAVTLSSDWFGVGTARADHVPAIVIPGNPCVPVIIDGIDATGGVVEGDWGLYRPGHGRVTVFPAPVIFEELPPAPHYFPSAGRPPRVGRDEVVPRRRAAMPAQSFYRSWTTDSGAPPVPADLNPVPYDPPAVIEAYPPRDYPRPRHRHHK
jgi:hypothetical protein